MLVEGPRRDGGEGILDALRVMSLYIDLNPIRAGLVEDPADYRWSGYGAAVGGGVKEAREGLTALVGARSWRQAADTYRMWLYANAKPDEVKTEAHPKKVRHGVALSKRSSVLNNRGRMSVGELIRCRVRYFSDGAIIGSKAFVAAQRDGGTPDREDSKKRRVNSISELEKSSAIFTLRKLRVDAVVKPGD